MTSAPIRVLVVDDSALAREVICRVLDSDPGIEVAGTAADGREAIAKAAALRPNLISMDIYMPEMDGLSAIQEIMASTPTPILVVTSDKNSKLAYRALSSGALDVVQKPYLPDGDDVEHLEEFLARVKLLSGVKVITHVRGRRTVWSDAMPRRELEQSAPRLIGIGASTGGPSALARLLPAFGGLKAGILIVQHLSEGFTQGLVQWLNDLAPIRVQEAMHGDLIEPGVAYVAPSDYHAEVSSGGRVQLNQNPLQGGHRPSIDVLFRSMAKHHPGRSVGVILTGMGADGAEGLRVLRAAGGRTLAQNEQSCLIFGMPKVAIELGAVEQVLPLDSMGAAIRSLVSR